MGATTVDVLAVDLVERSRGSTRDSTKWALPPTRTKRGAPRGVPWVTDGSSPHTSWYGRVEPGYLIRLDTEEELTDEEFRYDYISSQRGPFGCRLDASNYIVDWLPLFRPQQRTPRLRARPLTAVHGFWRLLRDPLHLRPTPEDLEYMEQNPEEKDRYHRTLDDAFKKPRAR